MAIQPYDFSGWNPKKIDFFEWFINPHRHGADYEGPTSYREFAEEHDVSTRSLVTWRHSEEFKDAFNRLAMSRFMPHVSTIMQEMVESAERGDYRKQKLFMKLVGMYDQDTTVTVNDARASDSSEKSEASLAELVKKASKKN